MAEEKLAHQVPEQLLDADKNALFQAEVLARLDRQQKDIDRILQTLGLRKPPDVFEWILDGTVMELLREIRYRVEVIDLVTDRRRRR
jgi:hypothetical protein